MIKRVGEQTIIKGTIPEVCTDLTIIVREIKNNISENLCEEAAQEMIMKSFDLGMKSEEEIIAEHKRVMKEAIKIFKGGF